MNLVTRKLIVFLFVIIGIILSYMIVQSIPWLVIFIGGYFSPNPSYPEITHEEFSICLEYKINDEYVKVTDVLVCEFDGFGFNEGHGKFRKWKAYLKSGKNRITLFKSEEIEIYYFPVKKDSRLPGVFMGDTEYYSGGTGNTFPDALYTTNFEDKTVNGYIISSDDMKRLYNLQLIKWECAPPIENEFV